MQLDMMVLSFLYSSARLSCWPGIHRNRGQQPAAPTDLFSLIPAKQPPAPFATEKPGPLSAHAGGASVRCTVSPAAVPMPFREMNLKVERLGWASMANCPLRRKLVRGLTTIICSTFVDCGCFVRVCTARPTMFSLYCSARSEIR